MKKKITCVVLFILVLLIIWCTIRVVKNNMIFSKMESSITSILDKGNYLYKVNCKDETKNITKYVYNSNKVKLELGKSIYYSDLEKEEMYSVNLNDNTYTILETSKFPQILPSTFINPPILFSTLLSKIHNLDNNYVLMLFLSSVSNDTYNGIECYKISILGTETVWIDKVTYLPVKNVVNDVESDYTIIANNVNEKDILFDNIAEFTESKE